MELWHSVELDKQRTKRLPLVFGRIVIGDVATEEVAFSLPGCSNCEIFTTHLHLINQMV
jgi:hypothetical protein